MRVMDLLDSLCRGTQYKIVLIDYETLERVEESCIQEINMYGYYDEYNVFLFSKKVMGVTIVNDVMEIMVYK